jgi:hypothetical protein
MRRKFPRLLIWLSGILCILTLLLVTGVRVDNYVLRQRAEHLLADFRSLELRKSTYSDARKTIDRYRANIRMERPCQPNWCDAVIVLNNTVWGHIAFFGKHQRLLDLYSRIGGRMASVRASIRVRNNVVWGKSFSEMVESGACSKEPDGQRLCLLLLGNLNTGAPRRPVFSHPEYEVRRPGGCYGCIAGDVTFTPYADPADVRRLSNISLSCITRLHPCESQADILPSAWREHAPEEIANEPITNICSQELTRSLSRQSGRVALGVVETRDHKRIENSVSLHVEKDLKPVRIGDWMQHDYWFYAPAFVPRKGDRYIVFFWTPEDQPQECLTPATTDNLRIAREGIVQDWAALLAPTHIDDH